MSAPSGYAEMFEWGDGNPSNEDRAGLPVVLYRGKIYIQGNSPHLVNQDEDIIGVVAGDNTSTAIITNGSPGEWHGKHLRDPMNRLLWEKQVMVEWIDKGFRHWYEADRIPEGIVPAPDAVYHNIHPTNGHPLMREILREEYKNPGKHIDPYLPRWERNEWGMVVLLGRVVMRDNCATNPRWIRLNAVSEMLNGVSLSEWLVR
jgi:hypothetical protein